MKKLPLLPKVPKTLAEVCEDENFSIELFGDVYCNLKMGEKHECAYQDSRPNHNMGYLCLHPWQNYLSNVRFPEQ